MSCFIYIESETEVNENNYSEFMIGLFEYMQKVHIQEEFIDF